MAQKVSVTLVDDLDGGVAEETVEFGIDGLLYEMELSQDNAERLREALAPYVAKGRRLPAAASRGRGTRPARMTRDGLTKEQLRIVRDWAPLNGYQVSDRGRLAKVVIDAWQAAGSPGSS